ncbi:hypothetical protein OsI_19662 [Oryza sativa Indica Group]|uniref:Uncharacterized protein n=1 Tax=Oryza sativa subsp. indica TaxID=39946 RepID=A2Y3T5_ORYSI|nr:hypothetical protein OsI_19662 [Oryza sativa Indica Group]
MGLSPRSAPGYGTQNDRKVKRQAIERSLEFGSKAGNYLLRFGEDSAAASYYYNIQKGEACMIDSVYDSMSESGVEGALGPGAGDVAVLADVGADDGLAVVVVAVEAAEAEGGVEVNRQAIERSLEFGSKAGNYLLRFGEDSAAASYYYNIQKGEACMIDSVYDSMSEERASKAFSGCIRTKAREQEPCKFYFMKIIKLKEVAVHVQQSGLLQISSKQEQLMQVLNPQLISK